MGIAAIRTTPLHRAWRPGLIAILLAAAMPVRIPVSLGVINSVSVLDTLIIAAAATLYFRAVTHRLDAGYTRVLLLLTLPLVASIISIAWSQDRAASIRSSLVYLEGLIAYLFVVNETAGFGPEQVLTYMKRWIYLLILPGILLLLHVPGFEPERPDLSTTSAAYVSYYTRLSHPILGQSNNLATVLAFFVPCLLYWGGRYRQARFTAAGITALIAVFLTLSRGVIFALVIAAVFYWLARPRYSWRTIGQRGSLVRWVPAIGLTLAAVLVLYEVNPATNEFFATRFTLTNVTDRLTLVSQGMVQLSESPLLGYGAGVPASLGEAVHNTYLQQMLSYGIPLGLAVSVSLFEVCRFFFAVWPARELGRVIGISVLVQLLIFASESSFEGTVLRVLFYLSLGLAVGLLRAAQAAPSSDMDGLPARGSSGI